MYKVRTTEFRIAVVGVLASGKTVFLTSLINHLQHHDPERFRLGQNGSTVRKFQELATDQGWERFPYQRYRDAIISGGWPEKTKDRLQYTCSFERKDWWLNEVKIKFYDLRGERIPDAVMAIHDYAGWSDHFLRLLEDEREYRACSQEFLDLFSGDGITEGALLSAYKRTLARLIVAFKPNISPSTFLLDTQGRRNRGETVEAMANFFYVGLDPRPARIVGQFEGLARRWPFPYL